MSQNFKEYLLCVYFTIYQIFLHKSVFKKLSGFSNVIIKINHTIVSHLGDTFDMILRGKQ